MLFPLKVNGDHQSRILVHKDILVFFTQIHHMVLEDLDCTQIKLTTSQAQINRL